MLVLKRPEAKQLKTVRVLEEAWNQLLVRLKGIASFELTRVLD